MILKGFTKTKGDKLQSMYCFYQQPKKLLMFLLNFYYNLQLRRRQLHTNGSQRRSLLNILALFGTNSIRSFKTEFPNFTERILRPWVSKYKEELKKKPEECAVTKLRLSIANIKTADGTINKHFIYRTLISGTKVNITRSDYNHLKTE